MSIGMLILLGSLVCALWKRSSLFALIWILGSCFLTWEYGSVLFGSGGFDYVLLLPGPFGAARIALNPLSALFGLIFSLGLPLGMIYGHYYLNEHHAEGLRSHLVWLGTLGISMHALLWVRHSLLFLMLWELMSLASFFAVIQDRDRSLKAGISYLITMQIGAAFLIAGFALNYLSSGSFDLDAFAHAGRLQLYLVLIGFAFKAGFFPFCSWLPQAHPVAPSHVSGIMSGLMIKTGLYGIIMMLSCNLFSLLEIGIFAAISLITAFWGVIHAMAEQNIKKALAFSSIENMGIIGISLSIGTLGICTGNDAMVVLGYTGALLHAMFHSLFKALLFYLSGNVLNATKTLMADELGGLAKTMPVTAGMFLTGVFAISALPLGNGFISEFAVFSAILQGLETSFIPAVIISIVMLAGMAFIGALALIAFTKIYGIVFLGNPRSEGFQATREASRGMLVPSLVLSGLIVLTGLWGGLSLRLVKPLLLWLGWESDVLAKLGTVYGMISTLFGILLAVFLIIYLLRRLAVKERISPTWGCGYARPGARMQYSSIAFIQPLAYFLKPFILLKKHRTPAAGNFPTQLSYNEEVRDAVWDKLIAPVAAALRGFLKLFSHIHNGKTNSYIAYSLAFIVILIIWIVGLR